MSTSPSRAAALVLLASLCISGCLDRPVQEHHKVSITIGAALPAEGPAGNGFPALASYFVTEPFLSIGFDGRPTARLADRWAWIDGRTKLQLTLRKGVLFHDGTPLSAELAAKALRKEIAQGDLSYRSVTSVNAIGPDAIEIDLSRPDAFLLEDLATFSVTLPGNPQIGTGPFERISSKPDIVLKAFDQYHLGRPAIDELKIKRYPGLRAAWAAMMRGEIDGLHEVSREAADFVDQETSVRSYPFLRSYYVALTFNVRNPVLGRPEVRRALNRAVDKSEIVSNALRGRGKTAQSPIWPYHWALTNDSLVPSYDPMRASSELDAAGLKVRTPVDGSEPSRFSFSCMVWADDTRYERMALILQKELFDIGVDMRLEPVSMRELVTRAMTGNFDAFLMEMASNRSLSYVYRFWHSPEGTSLLNSGYDAADEVLDRLRHATSDEQTRQATADLSRVLQSDPPAIFLAWQETTRAVSSRFDVGAHENRDVMSTVSRWAAVAASRDFPDR
jgi:peptide/nickel transport system substrate-binding protein